MAANVRSMMTGERFDQEREAVGVDKMSIVAQTEQMRNFSAKDAKTISA